MFNKKSRSQGRPQGDKHLTTSNRPYPPGGHVSDPYSLYGCPVDKIFPIQQSENIEWDVNLESYGEDTTLSINES